MTQEEKARRYDEVLKRAKTYWETDIDNTMKLYAKGTMEYLFPELRESDDEKIRKEIISFVRNDGWRFIKLTKEEKESWIAWLEKQNEKYTDKTDVRVKAHQIAWETSKHYDPSLSKESWCEMAALDMASWFEKQDEKPQGKSALEAIKEERVDNQNCVKPTDKAEPKFKVGDWIVYNRNDSSREVLYVYDIRDGRYYFNDNIHFSWSVKECDEKCHLWTIDDAKDGYILMSEEGYPFIYAGHHIYTKYLTAYCGITNDGKFKISDKTELWTNDNVEPATKEECNLLFQKMKESGYEWDAKKKMPKKIEQKSTWSEEDEEILQGIWDEILANKHNAKEYEWKTYDKFLDWLKSLKDRIQPQNTWKPSEEQMNALDSTLQYSQVSHNSFEHLNSLYNELEKLKE